MSAADAWVEADPIPCTVCGREACEDHLPPEEESPRATRLVAIRARDVMNAPSPKEIVEGIAWADRLTVLAAESGSGKTFVALELSAAISGDVPFLGRATQQGSVLYVSFEGDALGLRLRALRDVRGYRLDNLYFVHAAEPLSPKVTRDGELRSVGEVALGAAIGAHVAALRAEGRPPIVATVIDTARAAMAGSEDSSEHVSAFLRAVRRLMAAMPGAAMLLIHHTGWQDGEQQRKRERGSSAWRGNGDATLYLEAGAYDAETGSAPLTLRALKVRDAERPAPLHMIRRRVDLAESDRQGQPATTCVIERDLRTRQDREAEQAHASEAETCAVDVQVLRVMSEHPTLATSQERIRAATGLRRDPVYAAIARLLQRGWATPPDRQRQPYGVTAAGQRALTEATEMTRPESSRVVPSESSRVSESSPP